MSFTYVGQSLCVHLIWYVFSRLLSSERGPGAQGTSHPKFCLHRTCLRKLRQLVVFAQAHRPLLIHQQLHSSTLHCPGPLAPSAPLRVLHPMGIVNLKSPRHLLGLSEMPHLGSSIVYIIWKYIFSKVSLFLLIFYFDWPEWHCQFWLLHETFG